MLCFHVWLGSHTPASLAGLQTPATAAGTGTRHRLSTSSLAALKTPATHKTPGTAGLLRRTAAKAAASAGAGRAAADAAAAAGVGGIMVSPAPLTISKTGPRSRLREGGAAADENRVPGSGTGAAGEEGKQGRLSYTAKATVWTTHVIIMTGLCCTIQPHDAEEPQEQASNCCTMPWSNGSIFQPIRLFR